MNKFLEKIYTYFLNSTGISIDTRILKPGALFFCLKGENFDGNKFAKDALKLGASYVITDENSEQADARYIKVENSLTVLQNLSEYHRNQLKIPVLAITGTNGKTTTKELVARVLSKKFNILYTQGNLNNHIGVPLTLLSINQTHKLAVIEMGANHIGEIKILCKLAKPTHGIITNVGMAHLEGFGSPEGVFQAKTELYDWLANNEGTAFVNYSMKNLIEIAFKKGIKKIIEYGKPGTDTFMEKVPSDDGKICVKTCHQNKIKTNLSGKYNLENLTAVYSIGNYFGVTEDDYKSAIESYHPTNKRSEIINKDSNTILMDFYNANPISMKAAVDELSTHNNATKVAILGDMFELGKYSESEHEKIGRYLSESNIKTILLCGKEMKHAKKLLPSALYFSSTQEAVLWLGYNKFKDSVILIKGSRGMQMEKIAEVI
ncbi:MAG: hypothetical protein A3G23_10500 [Bacteroidetes bacterium RIFCSPLOWO2_12_FULL_37_12]|nr:MAG: hypothetical protein A3G23_10500 [Bacteroidetes bacterium RIFCSPLOWO2_12_FULL_37_12]